MVGSNIQSPCAVMNLTLQVSQTMLSRLKSCARDAFGDRTLKYYWE